ncbi:hypothetical protein OROGR_013323 [Orobanche gracilis]
MMRIETSSPPWQVLELLARRLDPPTLATAACVCKSWSISMSADHLWRPFCSDAYPSLFNLHFSVSPAVPYSKLFSLGRAADKRRLRKPPKPQVSMNDLVFAIDVVLNTSRDSIATVVEPGSRLRRDRNGIFRFDIEVGCGRGGGTVAFDAVDSLRITWNVVLDGFKGVFTVMDCEGKGSFVLGLEGWFSKELPASVGWCSSGSGGGASGLVADLRLVMREEGVGGGGGGRMVVEKIRVGMLSVVSWRYVCVDDALSQQLILPNTFINSQKSNSHHKQPTQTAGQNSRAKQSIAKHPQYEGIN